VDKKEIALEAVVICKEGGLEGISHERETGFAKGGTTIKKGTLGMMVEKKYMSGGKKGAFGQGGLKSSVINKGGKRWLFTGGVIYGVQ